MRIYQAILQKLNIKNPEGLDWSKRIVISYGFVSIIGIGWALINANSYPMIVELASTKTICRYTSLYYTFSMVAQTLTPIIAGGWMTYFEASGLKLLFIYSLLMIVIAGIIMLFFKEKKKVIKKQKIGFESLDND